MTPEHDCLQAARNPQTPWKKWGPTPPPGHQQDRNADWWHLEAADIR